MTLTVSVAPLMQVMKYKQVCQAETIYWSPSRGFLCLSMKQISFQMPKQGTQVEKHTNIPSRETLLHMNVHRDGNWSRVSGMRSTKSICQTDGQERALLSKRLLVCLARPPPPKHHPLPHPPPPPPHLLVSVHTTSQQERKLRRSSVAAPSPVSVSAEAFKLTS